MIRSLIFFVFCLGLPAARAALEASAKGVSVRVFAVALAKDQGQVCLMTGETRGPGFELPVYNLSEPQSLVARDFQLVASAVTAGTPARPLAKVHLPDQGSDFRVILVPTEDGTYQSVVVRGDDPKFATGDVFFINLSPHDILGVLGSTKLDLKSSAQEIVRLTGADSGGFFEVKFARLEQAKLLPVAETRWPVLRNNRSFLIFYNGKRGLPTYRAVDEFIAPGGSR